METHFQVILNKPDEIICSVMQDYLQKNNFVFIQKDYEAYWRGGEVFFSNYKCLFWSYDKGELTINAWVTNIGSGKKDLTSNITGKSFKKSLENLIEYLKNLPDSEDSSLANPLNNNSSAAPTQENTTQTLPPLEDPRRNAADIALILGIIGIVLSLFTPLIAFFFAIAALIQAGKCSNSPYKERAKAANICGLITIALCFIF